MERCNTPAALLEINVRAAAQPGNAKKYLA